MPVVAQPFCLEGLAGYRTGWRGGVRQPVLRNAARQLQRGHGAKQRARETAPLLLGIGTRETPGTIGRESFADEDYFPPRKPSGLGADQAWGVRGLL